MARATIEKRLETIERQRASRNPQPACPQHAAEVAKFSEQRQQALALAEKILMAKAATIDGGNEWSPLHHFSAAEVDVFSSLGWGRDEIRRELGRSKSILRWQSIAGSTADRKRAEERSVDAQKELDEQKPKLEAEIEKLQRKLRTLEREKTEAAADAEQRQIAVQNLRKQVPAHVQGEHSRRVTLLAPLRREIGEVKARVNSVRDIIGIDISGVDGQRQAQQLAHSWRPQAVARSDRGYVHVGEWRSLVSELREELPELEKRQETLQNELDTAKADADSLLDIYAG